jgi:hypothetical protein
MIHLLANDCLNFFLFLGDGFVKSPSAALRFTFVAAAYPVSTPHSPGFARLASGTFYFAIPILIFYGIILVKDFLPLRAFDPRSPPFSLGPFCSYPFRHLSLFRRVQDIPKFIIIGKGLPALHPDLFHNAHKATGLILLKAVKANNIGLDYHGQFKRRKLRFLLILY